MHSASSSLTNGCKKHYSFVFLIASANNRYTNKSTIVLENDVMCRRDSIAVVENFWRQVWQARNPDAIDDLVAEDFVITSGGVEIRSRPQFKRWVAAFLESIEDFRFEVIETFQNESGDRVVSRWLVSGRNNGFMGSSPCQSPIRMTGTAVLHVGEDGLIQHNWVERSALEVHRSLSGVTV